MKMLASEINEQLDLTFVCDNKRHLICIPYSKTNMILMATELEISPLWFHKDHYDIPKHRIKEMLSRCEIVSSKEIVRIIKEHNHGEFRKPNKTKNIKITKTVQ
jgi:hypothetical protein